MAASCRAFWRTVPDVTASLAAQPGLLWSIGIGEAPIGLQGTFSVWRRRGGDETTSPTRRPDTEHAIEQTRQTGWFAEELFARFRVQEIDGTVRRSPGDCVMPADLVPLVFTSGWASGINPYLVVLLTGLAGRFTDLGVPDPLSRTDVLVVAARAHRHRLRRRQDRLPRQHVGRRSTPRSVRPPALHSP